MLVVTVNVRKHGDFNKKRALVKKTKEVLVEVLILAPEHVTIQLREDDEDIGIEGILLADVSNK